MPIPNFQNISYMPTMNSGFGFGGVNAFTPTIGGGIIGGYGGTSTGSSGIVPQNLPINYPGQNPKVPYPTQTAPSAISGNVANLPGISTLASGINAINEGGALGQLSSFLPNYQALVGTASGNTGQELAGQLPQDVINEIQQSAAERGIITGGGANANAAYLRALGLTSLQEQQTGLSNLGALVGMAPKPPLFDPSGMLITPEQQQQAGVANALYQSAPGYGSADAANLKAVMAGIGAGRGPMGTPGPGLPPTDPNSAFSSAFPGLDQPELGPYGATNPQDPNAAYSNWAAWASTLPTNQSGEPYYAGSDYSDYTDTGLTDLLSE